MSKLLPSNSTGLERALADAMASISDTPIIMRELWNADTIPAPLLPWLAWAFSVDEWDTAWSDEQKRRVVKSAHEVQRIKGTLGSVRKGLAAIGLDVQVQEWFNQTPVGERGTFKLWINASQFPVTGTGLAATFAVINANKNLRSHIAEILISTSTSPKLRVGSVASLGHELTVCGFAPPSLIISEHSLVLGD